MDECTMNVHKSITYQVIGRYLAKSYVVCTYRHQCFQKRFGAQSPGEEKLCSFVRSFVHLYIRLISRFPYLFIRTYSNLSIFPSHMLNSIFSKLTRMFCTLYGGKDLDKTFRMPYHTTSFPNHLTEPLPFLLR